MLSNSIQTLFMVTFHSILKIYNYTRDFRPVQKLLTNIKKKFCKTFGKYKNFIINRLYIKIA